MASLSFIEKQKIEILFGMSSGYVLNFTNRTFQEFILDCLKIDIYKLYPDLSKANILRSLLREQEDIFAGKLINELLKYQKEILGIHTNEIDDFNFCAGIARRLLGKNDLKQKNTNEEKIKPEAKVNFPDLKKKLYQVTLIEKPNERGYEFERYLNYLFASFNLSPRTPYKITGEQIDGSFIFNKDTYLLEAKWKRDLIGVDDLRIFTDKITSKSHFTRGLFISFSGFSEYIFQKYNNNQSRFILLTVEELFIMIDREMRFEELLAKKVRALEEEGAIYKFIMELS
ncbi:restriction endonuclease [Leptospira weilii]|uniref:restriction endonuclease n=1 Tax=Leptospira weilii TaxID=28184 RepID=UPI001EF1DBCA|nr:restriction endonuclease [Leptospira weilii]ULH30889.1 restriction endonuclease [Leptospira weilii]